MLGGGFRGRILVTKSMWDLVSLLCVGGSFRKMCGPFTYFVFFQNRKIVFGRRRKIVLYTPMLKF